MKQLFKNKLFITVLPLVIFCVLSVVILVGLRENSQSFNFQDETDHVGMGWMMITFGRKLYTELSLNHQPIPVYFGALLMKLIPYVTLFDLIERIRLSMFLFLSLCGLALTWRFRWQGLIAYLLTYSVGYYYFAWHVLAESLAIPAVLYLFLVVLQYLFTSKVAKDTKWQGVDGILAAVAVVWVGFNLLPLWPFCLLVTLYLGWQFTSQQRVTAVVTGVLLVLLSFSFFSPMAWYEETVHNNLHYFIAYQDPLTTTQSARILFFPAVPFLTPTDAVAQTLLFPSVLIIGILTYSLYTRSKLLNWQLYLKAGFVYILLIILNSRVYDFPVAFYQAFHLFPYVAAFFCITGFVVANGYTHFKNQYSMWAVAILVLGIFAHNVSWAFDSRDKLNEYYVQYGTQESYAQLVKVFAEPEDTLFSGPDGYGYMNIISGLPIAGRQLFHLPWAYRSDKLRGEFHELIASEPPEFIYLLEDESGYHTDLVPVLAAQYTEIFHNEKRTHLYFITSKAKALTEEQQQYLQEKDFSFAR